MGTCPSKHREDARGQLWALVLGSRQLMGVRAPTPAG